MRLRYGRHWALVPAAALCFAPAYLAGQDEDIRLIPPQHEPAVVEGLVGDESFYEFTSTLVYFFGERPCVAGEEGEAGLSGSLLLRPWKGPPTPYEPSRIVLFGPVDYTNDSCVLAVDELGQYSAQGLRAGYYRVMWGGVGLPTVMVNLLRLDARTRRIDVVMEALPLEPKKMAWPPRGVRGPGT